MTPRSPLLLAFARLVDRSPDAPLVAAPGRSATVAELDATSRRLERQIADADLPAGRLVGVAAPGCTAFLAALLAVRRRGLVALLLDPGTPEPEQDRIGAALGASAFLRVDSRWADDGDDCRVVPPAHPGGRLEMPDAGVVKLTSGSSGEPKGIAFTDEILLRDDRALVTTMGLLPSDRLLATLPLSHSYGLSSLAVPALVRGTLLVTPDDGGVTSPLDAAEQFAATVFPTVPVYLAALLRLSSPPRWPDSLRLVISAGAPLAPATARRFRERFGRSVHVFYGASECGGICYDRQGEAAERGTVGTPVDGVRITLDADGDPGTVLIESPSVALGYLPVADPRLGNGRFRSDDLAAWNGRELALRGRRGDWINVDGRKVHPREVEAVLLAMDGVQEAIVFPVPIPGRGGSGVGALLAGDRDGRTYADVVSWCRRRLPRHKVPRSIRWVAEIPANARGKVDRAAVAAQQAGPPSTAER